MWHVYVFAIFYICLIFSPDVKGSCLEYGHSCWGAHGKRSSGPAKDGSTAQHISGTKNLRSYELPINMMSDDNANRKMENKFDIDEAFASAESLQRRFSSAEDNAGDVNDSAKKRSRNNFTKFTSDSDSSNSAAVDDGKRRRGDGQEERQQKRQREQQHKQQSLSLQQQRKYPQHAERWRRFPFYSTRLNTFDNSPLTLTDAETPLDEIQTRNTENDFFQKLDQLAKEDRRFEDGDAIYDFL